MISKRGRFASIRGGILNCSFLNNQKCDHEVEKVFIDGDFDFDDDLGPHFSQYPNLKEFEVREKNSRFVSHDGILYMRLGEEVSNSNIGTYCRYNNRNGDVVNVEEGLVLLCCPQSINKTDILIRKDCTVIYGSALYGCKLNSITIPDGIIMICSGAFVNVSVNKLIVPKRQDILLSANHNNVNKDVIIKCTGEDDESSDSICSFWREMITGEFWEK